MSHGQRVEELLTALREEYARINVRCCHLEAENIELKGGSKQEYHGMSNQSIAAQMADDSRTYLPEDTRDAILRVQAKGFRKVSKVAPETRDLADSMEVDTDPTALKSTDVLPATRPSAALTDSKENDVSKQIHVEAGHVAGNENQTRDGQQIMREQSDVAPEIGKGDSREYNMKTPSKASIECNPTSEMDSRDSKLRRQSSGSIDILIEKIKSQTDIVAFAEEVNEELGKMTVDKLWKLETLTAILIVTDAFFMGWQVHAQRLGEAWVEVATVGDSLLCLAFIVELGLRLKIRGKGFFEPPNHLWNIFDATIVLCSAVGVVFINVINVGGDTAALMAHVSLLRLCRLTRIWRLFQFLRTWESFRELRLFMHVLHRVCRFLLWFLVLALLIFYGFGVAFTAGASVECNGNASQVDQFELCMYFGSLGRSVASLTKAVSGGLIWSDLENALNSTDGSYTLLLYVCVLFGKHVLVAMLIAMTTVIWQANIKNDLVDLIHDEEHQRKRDLHHLHQMFKMMDLSANGTVSFQEFQHAIKNKPYVDAFFRAFRISTHDLESLYKFIDFNETNAVAEAEFVRALLNLKGEARTVDVLALGRPHESLPAISRMPVSSVRYNSRSVREPTDQQPIQASANLVYVSPRCSAWSEKDAKSVQRIKKVEERAVSLDELLDLRDAISKHAHSWRNMLDGEFLTPSNTNLYHLNYNLLAPRTAIDGVILEGLQDARSLVNKEIEQYGPSWLSMPIASGRVLEVSDAGEAVVKVHRGRFVQGEKVQVSQSPTDINGSQKNHGTPSKVRTPNACSWKELVANGPLVPRWFCSHWWGEDVLSFVSCCEYHAKLRRLQNSDDSAYWVCAYANCQHELDAEMGTDPEYSSFRKAMRLAEGTLLILDSSATPFERIWCDFELFKTIASETTLDIVTMCEGRPQLLSDQTKLLPHETMHNKTMREQHFPIQLIQRGLQTQLEKGAASVEADKQRILASMRTSGVSLGEANSRLHGFLARAVWPQAVKHNEVRSFKLAETLAQDTLRKRLQISLAHFDEVGDDDLDLLGQGLPHQLEHLILIFQECHYISDIGVTHLVQHIRRLQALTELALDFNGCEQLTDASLKSLAACLPNRLQNLQLHFDRCKKISAKGVHDLAQRIAQMSKLHFTATFVGTRIDKNFRSKAELLRAKLAT